MLSLSGHFLHASPAQGECLQLAWRRYGLATAALGQIESPERQRRLSRYWLLLLLSAVIATAGVGLLICIRGGASRPG